MAVPLDSQEDLAQKLNELSLTNINDPKRPYSAGDTLSLKLENGQDLEVVIEHVFLPNTMSFVALVVVLSSEFPNRLVLKLFDRRTAAGLRLYYKAENWSPELEQRFQDAYAAGSFQRNFSIWECKGSESFSWEYPEDNFKDLELEAYLYSVCDYMFADESRAYRLMEDVQGKHVPTLWGRVILSTSNPSEPVTDEGLACPGLLLDYIDGFDITKVAELAPPDSWQDICDRILETLTAPMKHGVFNDDLQARSIMIKKPVSATDSYEAFVIDFGLCCFAADFVTHREFKDLFLRRLREWVFPKKLVDLLNGILKDDTAITLPDRDQYIRDNGLDS